MNAACFPSSPESYSCGCASPSRVPPCLVQSRITHKSFASLLLSPPPPGPCRNPVCNPTIPPISRRAICESLSIPIRLESSSPPLSECLHSAIYSQQPEYIFIGSLQCNRRPPSHYFSPFSIPPPPCCIGFGKLSQFLPPRAPPVAFRKSSPQFFPLLPLYNPNQAPCPIVLMMAILSPCPSGF